MERMVKRGLERGFMRRKEHRMINKNKRIGKLYIKGRGFWLNLLGRGISVGFFIRF